MKISKTASGAIDFRGQLFADLGIVPGAVRAQKTTLVGALQITEPFELVQEDGQTQTGGAGDWILQGAKGDVYIVKDQVFQETYCIATG